MICRLTHPQVSEHPWHRKNIACFGRRNVGEIPVREEQRLVRCLREHEEVITNT